MSRLTELLSGAKAKDPIIGEELEREFKLLASRRAFGLNFERHRPENVELPDRPVRVGEKVRILPARGSTAKGDQRTWKVRRIESSNGRRTAHVSSNDPDPENADVAIEDLVVVADFRDYIYPGFVSTGKVEQGGSKPFHTVINGENFHVLQALRFTHRGVIDAIYIDPPYNASAKDWKYNNDYVDPEDLYHHSKWLAMMERRLKVARDLLRPEAAVLIVTIDEKEVHRLALLLEQLFPEAAIQMVTSVISAKGAVRKGKFRRVEEHLFFVTLGSASAKRWFRNMLDPIKGDKGQTAGLEWLGLRRREPTSRRGARPNQFYPIFVDKQSNTIHSIGDAVEDDVERDSIVAPAGTHAVWPLKPGGTEMLWGLTPSVLRRNLGNGYVRVSKKGTVQYLQTGTIAEILNGTIAVTGHAKPNFQAPP